VSEWAVVSLVVMAVALVAMAIGQLVLAVAAARVARQATDIAQEIRKEIRPILEKAQKIADDASKTTGIALAQAQRVSQLMDATGKQLEQTIAGLQDAVVGPVRQGTAVLAGIRAVLEIFRNVPKYRRHGREDYSEDALFIG
jgi:predicted PurR-regulated permease PerM